jgi:hypothetical protein
MEGAGGAGGAEIMMFNSIKKKIYWNKNKCKS